MTDSDSIGLTSGEHLAEAEAWLAEAKLKYRYGTEQSTERAQAAATIARTHATLAVQIQDE